MKVLKLSICAAALLSGFIFGRSLNVGSGFRAISEGEPLQPGDMAANPSASPQTSSSTLREFRKPTVESFSDLGSVWENLSNAERRFCLNVAVENDPAAGLNFILSRVSHEKGSHLRIALRMLAQKDAKQAIMWLEDSQERLPESELYWLAVLEGWASTQPQDAFAAYRAGELKVRAFYAEPAIVRAAFVSGGSGLALEFLSQVSTRRQRDLAFAGVALQMIQADPERTLDWMLQNQTLPSSIRNMAQAFQLTSLTDLEAAEIRLARLSEGEAKQRAVVGIAHGLLMKDSAQASHWVHSLAPSAPKDWALSFLATKGLETSISDSLRDLSAIRNARIANEARFRFIEEGFAKFGERFPDRLRGAGATEELIQIVVEKAKHREERPTIPGP